MTTTLIVSALCLLLLGTIVGVRAARAARARHWLGGAVPGRPGPLPVGLPAACDLASSKRVDRFFIARRGLLGPLVDAEYGSATFVAATRPATFEVRVSTTGLLARPAPSRLAP